MKQLAVNTLNIKEAHNTNPTSKPENATQHPKQEITKAAQTMQQQNLNDTSNTREHKTEQNKQKDHITQMQHKTM